MWLDALIFLPLVVLGLERLWAKGSAKLYAIALFATIMTNYYMGYMVCLFAVLYSAYLYWLKSDNKEDWTIRRLFYQWRKFLLVSIGTGLATSVVLVPSLLGMLRTGKSDFTLSRPLPIFRFFLSEFSELGAGTYNFDVRLDHLPSIYTGIIIVVLFFTYFFAKKVSSREKKGTIALMLVLFASFAVQPLNTAWHMFQNPAGFPYRNSFIFSFLIVRFAYEGFLHLRAENNLQKVNTTLLRSGTIFSILLMLGQMGLSCENQFIGKTFWLESKILESFTLIWLFIGLLILFFKRGKQLWLMIAMVVACLELGMNYQYAIVNIEFGSQSQFEDYYAKQAALLDTLKIDDPMARINLKSDNENNGYAVNYYSYNDSYLYDFYGTSSYTSTLEKDALDTLTKLGIYSKNVRRFTYIDDNPVVNLLLNVQYSITPKEDNTREIVLEQDEQHVYHNSAGIGMGFMIESPDVTLEKGTIIQNQEKILQSVRENANPYYREVLLEDGAVTSEDKLTTIQVTTAAAGNLFLSLPNVSWESVSTMTVNGTKQKTEVKVETNQLFNLGYFDTGEFITIQIAGIQKEDVNGCELATLDETQFNDLINELSASSVDLSAKDQDYLNGTVTGTKEGQNLFLSIPYDDGWIVKIDGKEVETKKTFGCFISVQVPEGTHEIALSYRSMPLIIGAVISGATVLIVGAYCLIRHSRKKKQ